MLALPRRSLIVALMTVVTVNLTGCSNSGNSSTDRQAGVLALAIAYPRQHDAAGFVRAALATTLGRTGNLSVLEASDLGPDSPTEPAARLVIRIHVPAHQSVGFGDTSTPVVDACYRIEYLLPSSSLAREPDRIDCPAGAVPISPRPPTPAPHLPRNTSAVLAQVLRNLPPSPTIANAEADLRSALPPEVRVDVLVQPGEVAVAAGVGGADQLQCRVAVRIRGKVHAVLPGPESLLPGEVGCRAALGLIPRTRPLLP